MPSQQAARDFSHPIAFEAMSASKSGPDCVCLAVTDGRVSLCTHHASVSRSICLLLAGFLHGLPDATPGSLVVPHRLSKVAIYTRTLALWIRAAGCVPLDSISGFDWGAIIHMLRSGCAIYTDDVVAHWQLTIGAALPMARWRRVLLRISSIDWVQPYHQDIVAWWIAARAHTEASH